MDKQTEIFNWIPFYEELADKLLSWRDRQKELSAFLEEKARPRY